MDNIKVKRNIIPLVITIGLSLGLSLTVMLETLKLNENYKFILIAVFIFNISRLFKIRSGDGVVIRALGVFVKTLVYFNLVMTIVVNKDWLYLILINKRLVPGGKAETEMIGTFILSGFSLVSWFKLRPYLTSRRSFKFIDRMDGLDFEYYVADLLKMAGFKSVKVSKGSHDFGVDIIARKGVNKYAIQCKRYKSKVGVSAVQEVLGGAHYYDADKTMVVTNSEFTKPAKELAKKSGTLLWDRKTLEKIGG